MNIIIDDASPQIRYFKGDSLNVGWIVEHTTKSKYADRFTPRYSEATFHGTFSEGDYMEYRFNGTGITIHGAKRPNHGVYGVKVDNDTEEMYDGSGTDIFQAVLYQKLGLDEKVEHVIRMTNYPSATPNMTGDLWMDIDHLEITHTIPSTMYTTYIDDSSPLIRYDPSWISYGYGTGGYYNLTDHMSPETDSSMELKFNGSSIQIFGGVNSDHGDYTISLDGGDQQVFNANNWQMVYQVPMYTASGLAEGEHTIKMTNRGISPQNVLGFDFAIVNSSIKPPETAAGNGISSTRSSITSGITPSSTGTAANESSTSGTKISIGALAGGISGGVVVLALIIVLIIWLFRRNKAKNEENEKVEQYHSNGYMPGNPSTGRIDLISNSATSPSEYNGSSNAWTSNGSSGTFSPTLRDRKRNLAHTHQHNPSSSNSNPYSNPQSLSNGSPISPNNEIRQLNYPHQNHPFLHDMQSPVNNSEPTSSTSSGNSPRSNNHQKFNNLNSDLTSPSEQHQHPFSSSNSPLSTSTSTNGTLPHTFGSPLTTSDESGLNHGSPRGLRSNSNHGHSRGNESGSGSGSESRTRIRDMNDKELPYTASFAGPTPPYTRENSGNSPISPPTSTSNQVHRGNVNDIVENEEVESRRVRTPGGGFAWG